MRQKTDCGDELLLASSLLTACGSGVTARMMDRGQASIDKAPPSADKAKSLFTLVAALNTLQLGSHNFRPMALTDLISLWNSGAVAMVVLSLGTHEGRNSPSFRVPLQLGCISGAKTCSTTGLKDGFGGGLRFLARYSSSSRFPIGFLTDVGGREGLEEEDGGRGWVTSERMERPALPPRRHFATR